MKNGITVTLVVLLSVSTAWSQAPAGFQAIEVRLKACNAAHPDIPGSAQCEVAAFVAADKQLNQTYGGIVAALKNPGKEHADYDPEVVRRLIAAERAWVVFRDAECGYRSTVALNAPLEGFEYASCRYALTKERINELTAPDAPQNTR